MLRLQAGKQADRSSQRHNGQVEFGSDPPRPRGPYKYEWLSWRFPPRFRRLRLVRPELASRGAAPLAIANLALVGLPVFSEENPEDRLAHLEVQAETTSLSQNSLRSTRGGYHQAYGFSG